MRYKPFIQQLRLLNLDGMADEYCLLRNSDSFFEMDVDSVLKNMVASQQQIENTKRALRLLKQANLPFQQADRHSIDYSISRNLNKAYFNRLLNCEWINEGRNLVITGESDVGKTWLGCAMSIEAVNRGKGVKYYQVRDLIDELFVARQTSTLNNSKVFYQLKRKLQTFDLLVVDNFGLQQLTIEELECFEAVCRSRFETNKSTMVLSPLHPEKWKSTFAVTPAMAAMVRLLVDGSYVFSLKKEPSNKLPYQQIFDE